MVHFLGTIIRNTRRDSQGDNVLPAAVESTAVGSTLSPRGSRWYFFILSADF